MKRLNRPFSIVVLLALLLAALAAYEFLALDGIAGVVFPLMFPDSTVYSVRWNYWSYRLVRKGMSVADVTEMLGPPMQQWDTDVGNGEIETRFAYTISSSDSHFRIRQIVFRGGKVVAKIHKYYVD